MLLKRIFHTICLLILLILINPAPSLADSIFPYKKEILLSNQERVKESVSFRNDGKKDTYISPQIYSYNPKTLEITEKQSYIFVKSDKEIYKVKPNETLKFEYEVIPISNMELGTYFNLIVFEKQPESRYIKESTPVGVIDNLSHLVVLHITDSSNILGITSEFAQINIEVINKGIPFFRPMKIKYVYQNTTNYVLTPEGEIQIYSRKGKYIPSYIKINKEGKRLYPKDTMEEVFEIDINTFQQIIDERVIIGRFYNGIDENVLIKETSVKPNYTILALCIIFVLSLGIFLMSILKKKIAKPA